MKLCQKTQQRLAALEAAQPQLVAFDAAHLPDDEPEGWGTPPRQLVRQDVDPDADLPEEAPEVYHDASKRLCRMSPAWRCCGIQPVSQAPA